MAILENLNVRGDLFPAPILSCEFFDVIGDQLIAAAHLAIQKLFSLANLGDDITSYTVLVIHLSYFGALQSLSYHR